MQRTSALPETAAETYTAQSTAAPAVQSNEVYPTPCTAVPSISFGSASDKRYSLASAQAQSVFSAKSLMELGETDAAMFVLGWMAGYASAELIAAHNQDAESQKLRVCIPPNTNGKIAFAVVQAHHNKLKASSSWDTPSWLPVGMFVHGALAAYWPCKP